MKLSTFTATLGLSAVASAAKHINYTTVKGYFAQDDPSTDPSTFDYTSHNFGLLDRAYEADQLFGSPPGSKNLTQWQRFHRQLEYLNDNAPNHVSYKLLFMGRHGEGWHNAAEDFYGTPAWNCYWALLTGNATATWFDADLTPAGIEQAQIAHDYWVSQYATQKIAFPDAYYSSPMTRALKTANITFSNLPLNQTHSAPFVPEVKEGFREGMSMHTCNARRSKSYIEDLFPGWTFEIGFMEEDEFWTGTTAEPSEGQDLRSRKALDDIFYPGVDGPSPSSSSFVSIPTPTATPYPGHRGSGFTHHHSTNKAKTNQIISITAHSGEITSILRVIGHQAFRLSTGAVIPVLVRAEEVYEPEPTTTAVWSVSAYCTAPPATSTEGGCVCASSAAPVTSGYPVFATGTVA
ncbi:phosphoglycerate mutase family protein [Aspergillus stella-maris]|uniref:phosphoglycerate mutase family protein n=1 Tax=Aspergillus stella-maris TaxID=1810926 RepID=UPI003CCD201E